MKPDCMSRTVIGIETFRPEEFYDLKEAKEGDINPKTGKSYEYRKTSEVGNIFDL